MSDKEIKYDPGIAEETLEPESGILFQENQVIINRATVQPDPEGKGQLTAKGTEWLVVQGCVIDDVRALTFSGDIKQVLISDCMINNSILDFTHLPGLENITIVACNLIDSEITIPEGTQIKDTANNWKNSCFDLPDVEKPDHTSGWVTVAALALSGVLTAWKKPKKIVRSKQVQIEKKEEQHVIAS